MKDTEDHVGFCPGCGNTAPQTIVHRHTYQTDWYGADGERAESGPAMEAILCICGTCASPLLYDGIKEWEWGEWPKLAYPKGLELERCVPRVVRSAYAEAARVMGASPNAFAVMIRRSLEALCDERGVPRDRLVARLNYLANDGRIPPTVVKATDVLRVLGNAGAHSSEESVTVPMTWAMDKLFRAVVEYVYVAPHELKEFEDALSRTRKEA